MKIKIRLLLLILLVITNTTLAQKNDIKKFKPNPEKQFLELPHTLVLPIKDSKTKKSYELYIKLPKDYFDNKNKRYPVLYYTDAMWHLEILSSATEYMLEDVILVGISWQKDINEDLKKEFGNHVSRYRDYSFREHDNPEIQRKIQFGQADKHLDFIRDDVIKYIENTYRTDSSSKTYFGYSMSGEFGAYILLTEPSTFNNYIIGSPSIKNEVDYLSELSLKFGPYKAKDSSTSLNANVFISYGSLEQEAKEPIEAFISLLRSRRDRGLFLKEAVIKGNHQTAFPMTAVKSIMWLSSILYHDSIYNPKSSFRDVPKLNSAFINTTPEDRKDGLALGKLGVDGGNKAMILKLAEDIAKSNDTIFDSFLITHKGKLLFESYFTRGRINLPHPQASATKSYTGLVLGRAIQLGYLTMDDLDKPLVSFLKDLDPTKFVQGVEKITLNHALTSRTGIRISEAQKEKIDKSQSFSKAQGQVQALLEHSTPITEASQSFKYGDGVGLVMQVIEAVVPGSAEDFIKDEFFGKIGITNYNWLIDEKSGLPAAGWRSSITSRDMMKIGVLVMNKGKWKGEQLIPEAFITKATSRIHLNGDEDVFGGGKDVSKQGYGYFWWCADLKVGNRSYFCPSAQGGGSQFIILNEELDLIVVFTGHNNHGNGTLQIMAEHIIPAFMK